MRIYIKTDMHGIPETETDYTVWQGFQLLGFQPILYQKEEELSECRPDDLIVGGVSTVNRRMAAYGITIPEYDYPPELSEYLGRRIWSDTLGSVLEHKESWPVFVKPVKDKVFTGFRLRTERDIPRLRHAGTDEPVLCSELVDFQTEWRCFVRYGNIWDVRPYRGDWRNHYNEKVLEEAVSRYTDAPAGYAMDFGVIEDGRTLLVEINDGYALGCYGADPVQYAKLLSARWCELVGIYDECDNYHERDDWRKRRGNRYYLPVVEMEGRKWSFGK